MTVFSRPNRDPHSLAFTLRGASLLQVSRTYQETYDTLLADDGLYRDLVRDGLGAQFLESGLKYARTDDAYRVVRQQRFQTPMVYPHEWSFSAWKAGALLTLTVMRRALDHDFVLKRATPHSIRFDGHTPLWADLVAFERYQEGHRWAGYTSFVRGWLAPLALLALVDPGLGRLFLAFPDGLPLPTVSAMLPVRTRMNLGLSAHIHLGGRAVLAGRTDKGAIQDTLAGLEETVRGLGYTPGPPPPPTEDQAEADRQATVRGYLGDALPEVVWDLAAGDGTFTYMAAQHAQQVVAFDADPAQVERLWSGTVDDETLAGRVLPVLQDWTAPSPNTGWAYQDQRSIGTRANPDLMLALGWVHRLVWRHGLPLGAIASFLARLGPQLITEFIPATDPDVIAHMSATQDPGDSYTPEAFEAAFRQHFEIVYTDTVRRSGRVIYLFRRIAPGDA